LITNLIVETSAKAPVTIPEFADDADELNKYAGKKITDVMSAAIAGTNQAYADDNRPTADILLPRLTAYEIGEVLQMDMVATGGEGRLHGINSFRQPGREAYQKDLDAELSK